MATELEKGSYYFTNPRTGNTNWVRLRYIADDNLFPNRDPRIGRIGFFEFEDTPNEFYAVLESEFISKRPDGRPRFESEDEKRERERSGSQRSGRSDSEEDEPKKSGGWFS